MEDGRERMVECLNEMLTRTVRRLGEKTFVISASETISYAEFDRRAARLANVFASLGVRAGDPVGLYLPSNPLLMAAYWACQKLGAIPTPMSAMYRGTEISNIVSRTGMGLMLTDADTYAYASKAQEGAASLRHILVSGAAPAGSTALEPLLAAAPEAFPDTRCEPGDTAALFFTSGTTGSPKGAMHSHFSQQSTLRDMFVQARFRYGAEVFLCAAPIFNNFGATGKMNLCIYAGATLILIERWNTRAVLDAIKRHRATYMAGTPTMFAYLCNEFDPGVDDLSSLRVALAAGASVPMEIQKQFEAKFGVRLIQAYGATETNGSVAGETLFGVRRPGSAGIPVGSSGVDIVDDQGEPLPPGERGEIRISGDCVGKGYWRDPQATAAAFTARGWLSGDIGYQDEDGYLYIVDRKKDLIICGGYNVYPLEVEDLLYTHPSVAVCALVGAEDAVKGEIPVAVVVPRAGARPTAAELIAYCRESLAAYKVPRQVCFLEEMPLGPSNKILKRELRAWIKEGRLQPAA